MASRLGADYPIEIETTSKPFAEYRTDEWADTELPCAPAIMIGEDVVTEGSDVAEEKVIAEIRKQLGMPPLEPEKKGIIGRLFK
jgi:hypothetical protein